MTEIDGVTIHFIHVRSRHGENALPLIMTHGPGGSVIELLETVGPLTDPTARRHTRGRIPPGSAVIARLRLLGRADRGSAGIRPYRTLMGGADAPPRLHRYVAQGGDVGALVTDLMGRQAVEGLVGYHLNLLTAVLAIGDHLPKGVEQERAAEALATFRRRLRLLPRDGNAATDDRLRPAGVHRSRWRPGCSTTTRTATRRSPARSSTAVRGQSHPGHHRRQHRCTGDRHRSVRPGRTGRTDERWPQRCEQPGSSGKVTVPIGFT